MIDKNVINRIATSINAQPSDLIIEIGPGKGALTKILKEKKASLVCFEIDRDLKHYLDVLQDEKTKIIYDDILQVDLLKVVSQIQYNNLLIVGNLPYYITTAILKHLIDANLDINEMIFMVQDEVANRFTAQPQSRDYGSITLYLQYYFKVTKLFKVGKNCFNPIPKVESAIIKFEKRENLPGVDKQKYFRLVNDSFKMKRKTLKNNLKDYDFKIISRILKEFGLNDNVRAEELSEEVFIKLTKELM